MFLCWLSPAAYNDNVPADTTIAVTQILRENMQSILYSSFLCVEWGFLKVKLDNFFEDTNWIFVCFQKTTISINKTTKKEIDLLPLFGKMVVTNLAPGTQR